MFNALLCDCRRYNLTGWAIQLNEVTPGLAEHLAPTDCRLRPDQHFLELGQYDQVPPCSAARLVACVGDCAWFLLRELPALTSQ